MRLVLIILVYLCTPLCFMDLQAATRERTLAFAAATRERPTIRSGSSAGFGSRARGRDKQEEFSFFSKVTANRLSWFIIHMNNVMKIITSLGRMTLEFVDHPVSQISETGARILRDLFSGGYYAHLNQYSEVYPADQVLDGSTDVGSGMQAFTIKRTQHVKNALLKHFDIPMNSHVPKIACAFSGGGMRACLSAAGFLAGAEQTGLLDCVMYNAALQGGSWAVASASYIFAKSNPRITFTEFKNNLVKHLDKGTSIPGSNDCLPPYIEYPASNGVARNLFRRIAWDQPLSSMDLYGALIANITLQGVDDWNQSSDGIRFDVKFSDVAVAAQQGILPLPILSTAVLVNSDEERSSGAWMTFTPLRAGTKDIGGYLPMWAMGRSYVEGQNDLTYKGFSAEYSLAYLLGAYDLASNINAKYLFDKSTPVMEVQGFKVTLPLHVVGLQSYPFKIHNFTQDLEKAPLYGEEFMTLVNGASCCSIPLPVVAKPEDTAADIIIMIDSDLDVVNATEMSGKLEAINNYFAENNPGIMPELDPTIGIQMYANDAVVYVFNDPRYDDYDSKLPIVIYFPFIRNKEYSQTFDPAGYSPIRHPEVQMVYGGANFLSDFNFKYTQSQAQMVADLMEYNVKQSIPEIKEVLQAYMQLHKKEEKQFLDPKYKEKKPGISFDLSLN